MNRKKFVRDLSRAMLLALGPAMAMPAAGLCLSSPAWAVQDSAATPLEEAGEARAKGDLDAASIILRSHLQQQPRDLPARLMLGEIYLQMGTPLPAEKELEMARSLGASDQRINSLMAQAYIQQGKFAAALEEVGESGPEDEPLDVLLARAQAMAGLGRLDESRSVYEQALRRAPRSPEARVGMARAEMRLERWDAAEQLLTEALSANPAHTDAQIALGELAQARGNLAKAVDAFSLILDLNPDMMQVRLYRAATYVDLNRLDDALRDVEAVLSEIDFEPQALFLKAQILALKGDDEGANEAIRKAADLLNNADQDILASFPSMLRLGGILNAALEQNLNAVRFLESYLTRNPDDPVTLKWLAALQMRLDAPAEAIPYLQRVLDNNPEDVAALNLMGTVHLRMRQFTEALPYFEKASTLAPDRALELREIGGTLLSIGRPDDAVAALSDALAREPANLSLSVMLVYAHIRNNDTEAARELLDANSGAWADSPIRYQLAATIDIADGRLDDARDNLSRALDIQEGFEPAQLALARIELQTGNYGEAREIFSSLASGDKKNTEALRGLAATAAAMGDDQAAIDAYEAVLKLAPGDGGSAAGLMRVRIRQGATGEAERIASTFLEKHGPSLPVMSLYARILVDSGRTNTAMRLYNDAATLSPHVEQFRIGLAEVYLQSDQTDKALETLETAVRDFPDGLASHRRLAQLALRQDDANRASRIADAYLNRHPRDADAVALKGSVLLGTGATEEAFRLFSDALETMADGALHTGRVRAAFQLGRIDDALPGLATWVDDHPGDTDAKSMLAGVYQAVGMEDRAMQEYEELLERLPNHAGLLNNLAWLYHSQGIDKALETARKAYDLRPDDPNINDTYGWLLLKSGDAEGALPLLRLARSQRSSSNVIRFHTAVALYEVGQQAEARRELEDILDSGADFEGRDEAIALLSQLETETPQ